MAEKTMVWLLTQGAYSDYHVVGAYESKELAERMKALMEGVQSKWQDSYWVEECELNPGLEGINAGLLPTRVYMTRTGEAGPIYGCFELEQNKLNEPTIHTLGDGYSRMEVMVLARDYEHAVKIANEIRTQLIANNRWPSQTEEI